MGFVNHIDVEEEISHVARDVQALADSRPQTGLILNIHMCEITARNFDLIDKFPIFHHFKCLPLEDITLLRAPVLAGRAVDAAFTEKGVTLEIFIKRLSLLMSHDSLCLLENSIAMPKLLAHLHVQGILFYRSLTMC